MQDAQSAFQTGGNFPMNKKDEVLKKLRKRGDPGKKKTKRKLLLDDIEPEVKQSHEEKK